MPGIYRLSLSSDNQFALPVQLFRVTSAARRPPGRRHPRERWIRVGGWRRGSAAVPLQPKGSEVPADDDLDVDFARLYAEHQPNETDPDCRVCGEEYPCGVAWVAGRILDMRERRARRKEEHEM